MVPQTDETFTLPMSFAQQRLWFLEQYEPGTSAFNIPMAVRLSGTLNLPALEKSMNSIIARHESLRTTFGMVADEPSQIIWDRLTIDLTAEPADARGHEAIDNMLKEISEQPFNLSTGPLLRVRLLRLGHDEHLLILCLHHIICDGWSIGIFLSELSQLYEAFSAGRQPTLPELEIQYADFSDWQHKMLDGDIGRQELAYWKNKLQNAPSLLELPTDHPRPAAQTFRGNSIAFELDPHFTAKLQELARQQGCTLLMVLLSGFMVLLGRLARKEDVIIGTPIANRTRSEIEPLIGFFVNTIALRGDLAGNPDFLTLLGRIRDTTLDAYANQNTPFEKLVEALDPQRNLAQSPIFQVMFAFQNMPDAELALCGIKATPVKVQKKLSHYDLTLTMTQTGEQLEGNLEYNIDLWDKKSIEQMICCFKVVLEHAIDVPAGRIMTFPLLGKDILETTVLSGGGKTTGDAEITFPSMFATQVERTPHALAATFGHEKLTYNELDRRADALQPVLLQNAVGPGVLVGVCLERSLDLLATLLAVMKSGAAYVPLDPDYPADRIATIIKDSAMPVLLSSTNLESRLPACGAKIVFVDDKPGDDHPAAPCKMDIPPDHLAYTIYTSGSTGRPKGVQITHLSLANFLLSMAETPGMNNTDGLLALTTVCFDIAALELFLPLSVGGCVHMVSSDTAADGTALAGAIEDTQATVVQATPATWRLLLAAGWRGKHNLKILCGGEACPVSLAHELLQGDVSLWNMYGPTETTIWSAAVEIKRESLDSSDRDLPVRIGGPIQNTQLYVLDDYMNMVPPGMPGELHIGGAGLARGYLNRPGLTAERFVPDPFSSRAGARLYKTGDLVRLNDRRTLEFLGRTDHQIKIRGFRIELGEIESVLGGHPQIKSAVVTVSGSNDNPILAAYIVTTSDLSGSACRAFLATFLPSYMIPSAFVMLEALPLTPNGKVDRNALPSPYDVGIEQENGFAPPETILEKRLAVIWENVLGGRIGLKDDFFARGGHSLLAMKLIAHINKKLSLDLPVQVLFRNPTIERLANAIACKDSDDVHPQLILLGQGSRRPPIFCVPGAGGHPSYLRQLALHVDRAFFGFLAAGLDGKTKPHDSIHQVALEYLAAIRTVQPAGPYFLMGHSFGSRVAYEMARLLFEQGEVVPTLVVLDTVAPIFDASPVADNRSSADCIVELAEIFEYLTGTGMTLSRESLIGKHFEEQIMALKNSLGGLGEDLAFSQLAGMVNVYQANHRMYYKAKTTLPSSIILIKASETIPSSSPVSPALKDVLDDPAWGWAELSESPIITKTVTGNHLTMMTEPHVRRLADLIKPAF